jgi:hypothetical protein
MLLKPTLHLLFIISQLQKKGKHNERGNEEERKGEYYYDSKILVFD